MQVMVKQKEIMAAAEAANAAAEKKALAEAEKAWARTVFYVQTCVRFSLQIYTLIWTSFCMCHLFNNENI